MATNSEAGLPRFWRWGAGLVRNRYLLAGIAIALAALGFERGSRLTFDQSLESLYAKSNPRLQAFQKSKATFGGDEFLIVAFEEDGLFDQGSRLSESGRQKITLLGEALRRVPGIDPTSVQHLADALRFPYARQRIHQLMKGLMVGDDSRTTAIISRLIPRESSPTSRTETFQQVRDMADRHEPPAVVVGEPIQVQEMFRYVQEDGQTLGWASAGLLMLVMAVFFRSVRWMVLPLLLVWVVLAWSRGIFATSGLQLSMVSSMLSALVTIIGMATLMHIAVQYQEYSAHHPPAAAMTLTLNRLLVPILWTTLTTAAGFAALLSSTIAPVFDFGLMMSVATLLVFVAVVTFVPAGVLVGAKPRHQAALSAGPTAISLSGMTRTVMRRPRTTAAIAVGFVLFCVTGLAYLKVETDFSKNFRASSPLVKSLDFFETRLGGAGNWEVNFNAPETLTEEYVEKLVRVVDKLRELETRSTPDRLTKVLSVSDGLAMIPERMLFTKLPLETRLQLLTSFQSTFVESMYNSESGRMRIMLRALERQPSELKLALISDVETICRTEFPEAEATGLFVLLAYLIDSLMGDQLTSFLWSAAALVVLMAIAERSLVMGVALLVPNLFPIVLVIGFMGWVGMPINIATAMIASVSLGLTVDSSIHYMASYRAAIADGLTHAEAIDKTASQVGVALLMANVALVIGFSVLALSHFIPLVYFGLLVSLAMLGGLAGNLILLPLILNGLRPARGTERVAMPRNLSQVEEAGQAVNG